MKHLIIYGSSSGAQGHTWALVSQLKEALNADLINVSDYQLGYYSYAHDNQDDGFKDIAHAMVGADCIIFATPVYWYAMSSQLKVLFDRMSDLITIRKPLGRQLKGKTTALVVTGHDAEMPEGFTVPFQRTSDYFDMTYKGRLYVCTDSKVYDASAVSTQLATFVDSVSAI